MKYKILDKNNYHIWNDFVDVSPQGSIYAKTWYLDALNINYQIGVLEKDNCIYAGIVLAENEIHTYSNPLLVKFLGILYKPFVGKDYTIATNEIKHLTKLLKCIGNIKTFDYFFHPQFTNWTPFYWGKYRQQTYYTYRIDFKDKTLEQIYQNFDKKIKNEIKNAIKSQITIIENVEFDAFFEVIEKTFLRQGGKSPFNKKRLKYFIETLSGKYAIKLFAAKNINNDITAVAGVIYDTKCAYLILNGIDHKKIIRGTNEYLLYKTIEYSHNNSQTFDFEGSMIKPIESFYRKFGGTLTPYMRIWKSNLLNFAKMQLISLYKKIKYGK